MLKHSEYRKGNKNSGWRSRHGKFNTASAICLSTYVKNYAKCLYECNEIYEYATTAFTNTIMLLHDLIIALRNTRQAALDVRKYLSNLHQITRPTGVQVM